MQESLGPDGVSRAPSVGAAVPGRVDRPVRLALDPGAVRIGVARSAASLAFPVGAVLRSADLIADIRALAQDYAVTEIVIGVPVGLAGVEGASAVAAREFADSIATALPELSIRLVDERLTTVQAAHAMSAAGKSAKAQKSVIDAAAATVLLQHVLDTEARVGHAPGELLQVGRR